MAGVIGEEHLTVAGTSVGFAFAVTNTVGIEPMAAACTVEDGPIRYRTDGTVPTASVGTLVNNGGSFRLVTRQECRRFRAIRTSGVSAICHARFEA